MEETVGIEKADITGAEPTVIGKDFLGALFVAEVAGEDVGTLEYDDAGLVERDGFFRGCIDEPDRDSGEQLSDRSVAAGRQQVRVGFLGRVGHVDVCGRRCLGEAVALHRANPEFFLERIRKVQREFFRAGDHEVERLQLGWVDAFHVATEEGRCGEQDVDLVE